MDLNTSSAAVAPIAAAVDAQAARFESILWPPGTSALPEQHEAPDYFHDLNLDQVVDAVTKPWPDYDLAPFFHTPLPDLDTIGWRQEVMRDLDDAARMAAVREFAAGMRAMRQRSGLAAKMRCKPESERWFVAAVDAYTGAVEGLRRALEPTAPPSRGLRAWLATLDAIVASAPFRALVEGADRVRTELAGVRYATLIQGDTVVVRDFGDEPDYTAAVEATFAKFRRGAVKDYRAKLPLQVGLNHIETQVLERVARLNPGPFRALEAFCAAHPTFVDERVARFDREVHFYVAYLAYVDRFRRAGLGLCLPALSRTSKAIEAHDAYDLGLAAKLLEAGAPVVCNGFELQGPQRVIVVTGPNNGGKTTFARMFGQMHHLASLGCPVPGTRARLFHFDRLFTHFERQEDIRNLRGKLQDDLVRMRSILEQATPSSLVVMNEIFSSTTLRDAIYLATKVMARISALDLLAVCVTFLTELASFDAKTVSLVAAVDPDDPARRTYRLEPRPADGRAYALSIARRYRVTHDQLLARIGR